MKRVIAGLVLALALFAISAKAGTVVLSDTFTFGGPVGVASCSNIATWDGSATTYAEDMGAICLNQGDTYGGYGSFLDVPEQLGYLNGGYLAGCNPIAFGPKVFTVGDGTHSGDAFTVSGSTTCPYYTGEWGTYENSNNRLDGFSVVANYTVVQHRSCYRGRCVTYFTNVLQGGSGVVTDSTIN